MYVDDKGAGLSRPEGVACDGKGRLVVGDTGNDRLLRFTYRDKTVERRKRDQDPRAVGARRRIQLNSKGDIYALDSKQRRIVHLGPEGDFKDVLSFDGRRRRRRRSSPKSFAIDAADNIYVLDVFSARVLVLNAAGQFQKALPLPDDAGFVSDLAVDCLREPPPARFRQAPDVLGREGRRRRSPRSEET